MATPLGLSENRIILYTAEVRVSNLSVDPGMRRRGTYVHVGVRGGGVLPLQQAVRLAPVAVAALRPAACKQHGTNNCRGERNRPVPLHAMGALQFCYYLLLGEINP